MRDHGINLIVLNSHSYETRFRKFIDNISVLSFRDLIHEMKANLDSDRSVNLNDKFSFAALYEEDTMTNLKKGAFEEVAEEYEKIDSDSVLQSKMDISILQPILFYSASAHFKDKFYEDLAYHPPIDLSKVFMPFLVEFGKAQPTLIEIINPFHPMGEDIAEKGAIYYSVLKPALLTELQNQLSKVESTLTNRNDIKEDIAFLRDSFDGGLSKDLIIIIQVIS